MKYTNELTKQITEDYLAGKAAEDIALSLSDETNTVSERSIIAKLSHLGVYKKKGYLNKQGAVPIKKSEYITKLSALLDVEEDQLESLAKANKAILALICKRLCESPSDLLE